MKKKLKAGPLHKLLFVADFPHTLDMKEMAAQTIQLQNSIASIIAGLIANQVPISVAVSIGKGKPNLGPNPGQAYNVTLYWREIYNDSEMHMFKDLTLAKRCLDCADFKGEAHICNFQNQEKNDEGEDEAPEEILQ